MRGSRPNGSRNGSAADVSLHVFPNTPHLLVPRGNRGSWVKVLHGNFPVREKKQKKPERDGGDGQTFPNLQQSQSSCLAVTTAPLECVFERFVGAFGGYYCYFRPTKVLFVIPKKHQLTDLLAL